MEAMTLEQTIIPALSQRLAAGERVLLAIDGRSAAGKTTLAAALGAQYGGAVFHMDDFFLRPAQRTPERCAQPGGNVDRERVLAEVLEPLSRGEDVTFRRYDCRTGTLQPPQTVRPGRLVIVEGAYAMHPELAGFYDLSVFLTIDPAEQRRRILARNGPDWGEDFFRRWIPLEETYFSACRTEARCTWVLRGEKLPAQR